MPGYGLAEHTVYVCDGGRIRLRLARAALEVRGILQWHCCACRKQRGVQVEQRVVVAPDDDSNAICVVGCGAAGGVHARGHVDGCVIGCGQHTPT